MANNSSISASYILIHYTDGEEFRKEFPFESSEFTTEDQSTYISVQRSAISAGLSEYTFSLKSIDPKPIKYFNVEFHFKPDFLDQDTRMFMGARHTNNTPPLDVYSKLISQENRAVALLFQPKSGLLRGFAYSSVDRFWTDIKVEQTYLSFRHHMEDKPLYAGEEYRLERIITGEPCSAHEFLDAYARLMADRYNVKLKKEIPTGFCSWSIYYKSADQNKILHANDELNKYFPHKSTNLVQIDDSWQGAHTFDGFWREDLQRFPDHLSSVSDRLKKDGRRLGLWAAPVLVSNFSGFFKKHPEYRLTFGKQSENDDDFWGGEDAVKGVNIENPGMKAHILDYFRRAKEEYGADYFKIDFMYPLLHILYYTGSTLKFEHDYGVAVYRELLRQIRQTVGDSFMLACISPVPESIGYYDAIRASEDITWGKSENNPNQYELFKMNTKAIHLRYFMNNIMFLNDPDGLVVRDYDANDNCDITYSEARLWATTVAFSGGSCLINERMDAVGPKRLDMFEQLLPPIGIAGRPVDFFELPQSSLVYIEKNGAYLAAAYNWGDKIAEKTLKLSDFGLQGKVIAYDCWEKKLLGIFSEEIQIKGMMPHSAHVLLIRPLPDKPAFVFAENNIYAGIDMFESNYDEKGFNMTISERLDMCVNKNYYVFVPNGFEMNGESSSVWDDGRLLKFQA